MSELLEFLVKSDSEIQPKLDVKPPRKYKVILKNDDYTPQNFVIDILIKFFYLTHEKVTQIMLQVHNTGAGVCGIFTKDVAETKVELVSIFAKNHEYPLLCSMEPASG